MRYKFSFERLRVWEDAMALVEDIYSITANFPNEERFGLTDQIRRAAVSVPSNLAEGSARKSPKEQIRFTEIAFSSLMEVHCQIQIAERLRYLPSDRTEEILNKITPIAKQLNGLKDRQSDRIAEPEIPYEPLIDDPITPSPHHPKQSPHDSITYFAHETAVVDLGATIGTGTKIWHFSHIMSGAMIGENCNLGQNVFVGNNVILGNNVKVQNNVSIYEGVTCEDDVFLGPSMVFTNVINPRSAVNRKHEFMKTHVGKGATIGANATIICGNNIGNYAFIGAGAVVTKEVPAYALIVGNPAHQIGWMSEDGSQKKLRS